MLSTLLNLLLLLGFAWLARALLDARSVTWGRLLGAAFLGVAAGYVAAILLLVPSVEALATADFERVRLIAFPFQVVATMGAIVVLELLFGGGQRRAGRLGALGPGPLRRLALAFGIAGRAWTVSRIAARHGLAPLLGLGRGGAAAREPAELARRARAALEEAGGVFVKLGQLLATRPDLLPPEAVEELGKLHASVAPLPARDVRTAVAAQLDRPVDEVFARFDERPLGSASIAQAHAAQLTDGREVVVKVRRPGLQRLVDRDLAIAGWLARRAERATAWGRRMGVADLGAEFGEQLRAELDFRIEARCVREIAAAVEDGPRVHVPRVIDELTSDGVLVLERLAGRTLAELGPSERPADARELADALCGSQIRSMLAGERFHGDPHPGNVLLLEDGRLGLIDLGLSARLDAFERAAVYQMLLALQQQQPALLLESMASLGAVDPSVHDPDEIERALARFLAALGPGMPPGDALTDLLRLVTRLGMRLPPPTIAMFRALSTLAGTLEHLSPGYPIVDAIGRLGGDEFQRRLMPGSVAEWVKQEWSRLGPVLRRAPRHLDRLATQFEHGRVTLRVRTFADPDDRRFVETLANRAVLGLLAVGAGAVSVMLLNVRDDPALPLAGVGSYEALGWLGLFVATTLLFRVLLSVVRSEQERPRRR
jgi:ubiquinone biosynthesis protein